MKKHLPLAFCIAALVLSCGKEIDANGTSGTPPENYQQMTFTTNGKPHHYENGAITYYPVNDSILLAQNDHPNFLVTFRFFFKKNIKEGEYTFGERSGFQLLVPYYENSEYFYMKSEEESGKIHVYQNDTVHRIIRGSFHCTLKCEIVPNKRYNTHGGTFNLHY